MKEKILIFFILVLVIFFLLGIITLLVHGNAFKNEEYDCMGPSGTFYKCSVKILQLYTFIVMLLLGGSVPML